MARHFMLLPVLLLALFLFSVSGQLIASINCGEKDIYTDSNFIVWMPDETLVSDGEARVVQSSNKISPVLDTLRVFTSRKKNCYSASVTQGQKVLVRAIFNYGNYDGLSSPPTFDLHFDGNYWTTVETSMSGDMFEVIYVAKGSIVSVCVAQTKSNQFPFISSLEFRSVDSDVYSDVDDTRALFLTNRYSYGASEAIRYPNDRYDRIWVPRPVGTAKVTSDAIFIDPTGTNNPPSGILQNAVTAASKADSLIVGTISPSQPPVYLNMYFSEVSNLDSTETRSFRIYETSSSESNPISQAISPPYGGLVERNLYNYTVDSITNISLVATTDSDYPPLINAIETFYISDVLTDGTDSNDVTALVSLQSTFPVLGEWSGDPCLPAPYSWDWLNCSNDPTPRVTSLYLDSFELSGILPDISSMDALEMIDLHNNSLIGTIPGFLGTMSNLQQLNLADNLFSGPIPTSLSKNNKLKLNVTGNPSLCTSGKSCPSSPGADNSSPGSTTVARNKKSSKLPVVLGTTIPTFFLFWIATGVAIILRRRAKPAKANIPVATGVGAHGHPGGGSNGNAEGQQRFGEEFMENVVQQTFGSPSPLLDTSGQTSDLYGQAGVQNP